MRIPVEVSARHVHLSRKDLEKLFGKDYKLRKLKDLTLPGEFSAKEGIKIKTKRGELSLRVVGPERKETQVELSITDAFCLGIDPVVRVSGSIESTPGAFLIGPNGKIRINNGVIVAQRHIHCNKKEAEKLKLKNNQTVSVEIPGKRGLVFKQVKVRIKDNYILVMHLDADEGNSAGVDKKTFGYLI
ncbi:MAG: propanediol utilization protein [Candidatus Nealsonbacteria bacterium RIFOXYB1_FULL_40_15]|uniref:Phosphate propanoyltransferase n=2 Tax=Candidatus Nealsoniibacteriota TaxID=1817911 RepID=A0A1G2ESL9_9BACT|nr:MAG: propanediol utilization protein [Candidatus Nealsonbacteria bacterium RIFOXYB1_FULL_40_15]OGZ28371.1 MAG: propanediol utilization protein [Candidatus Nealsonbacteria bacterium RIFOXYC1_FULL_40_7]OGZ29496.1 MAG: propanediol utilization protein [Candidatus Nealsonbacteria bacterium RIFOXYD1_FULL_39_11]